MQTKNARLIAIALLRERGEKVSNCAGSIGLARKLGLSVRPGNKRDAKRALREYFKSYSGAAPVFKPRKKRGVDFYATDEWRSVRYKALLRSDGKCQCCGASKADGKRLHVDHIKPRSKHPELALSVDNPQVLCEDCNLGKSNTDATDWRHSRISGEYSDAALAKRLRLVA